MHRFVLRVMQEPEKFLEHIRLCVLYFRYERVVRLYPQSAVTATILRVTYGLQVSGRDDEYVVLAEATVAIQNAITVPGKYLVEVLPFLRFLPSWLPGAKFRREGKTWMPITRRMRDAPWDFTMKTIVRSKFELPDHHDNHICSSNHKSETVRQFPPWQPTSRKKCPPWRDAKPMKEKRFTETSPLLRMLVSHPQSTGMSDRLLTIMLNQEEQTP